MRAHAHEATLPTRVIYLFEPGEPTQIHVTVTAILQIIDVLLFVAHGIYYALRPVGKQISTHANETHNCYIRLYTANQIKTSDEILTDL